MNQRKVGAFAFVGLLATVALLGCTNFPKPPDGKPVPAETPVFDFPAGTYPQAVQVIITCATEGATIYYTTDNSAPTDTNGTVYTSPIRITATTTLKAIAYKEGLLASLTATGVYTIGTTPPVDNKAPVFHARSLLGFLVAGEPADVALTCTVTDDGSVGSVTADLRPIGGAAAHALAHVSGDLWAWSGTVQPTAAGLKTITFTAADNYGAKATAVLTVDVLASRPAGQEKWHFTTQDWIWSSPALAADGTVYVGSLDGNIYAVKPDGSQRWVFAADSYVYSSPAVGADGTVYAGSRDFKLYAIAPDGNKRWEFAGLIDASPAIGHDGTIYIGSVPSDGIASLYAINPDGTAKWQFATNGAIWSSPAVGADGTIYFGARDYNVYAVDADGNRKWQFYAGDQVDSSPAVAADGTVYVGCRNGQLYSIDTSGQANWSLDLGSAIHSSPAIGADGTIYVGCSDGRIYAVNPNGSVQWHFATGGAVDASPLVGSDGTIYVGSRDGSFYAIGADGLNLWAFPTAGPIISSPVISPSGTIYFGSYDGNLYAVSASGTLADSDWPMFRRGPQHTARMPAQPTNQPPQFDSVSASITQQVNHPGTLSILCQVSDPDDTVASVTADLSSLDGSSEQPLTLAAGQWTWSGTVPFVYQTALFIPLKATDSRGAVTTTSVVPTVTITNSGPTISNVSVLPNPLTQDVLEILMVSCIAVDEEGSVASVEVDTSAIDGTAARWRAMLSSGTDSYSHYDYVIPATSGQVYITIRAIDDMGVAATYSFPITINPSPVPTVSIIAATTYPAPAIAGRYADVMLSCSATPASGRFIGSVKADLSAFGGSSAEPMGYDSGSQTWSVSVNCLMPDIGNYQVRLTASDNLGFSGFAEATITVQGTGIAGVPFANTANDELLPDVSGDVLVWQEFLGNRWEIHARNIVTMTDIPLGVTGSSRRDPKTDGTWIVWEDDRDGNPNIYGWQLPSGPAKPICLQSSFQSVPDVSGKYVVWRDYRNSNWDIYGYDLQADTEFPVCTAAGNQEDPRISGNYVVWADSRAGSVAQIFCRDLRNPPGSEIALSPAGVMAALPAIDGSTVVWMDARNGNWDIFAYDLSTDQEMTVFAGPGEQGIPAISGPVVIWQDSYSGPFDLWGRNLQNGLAQPVHLGPDAQSNAAVTVTSRFDGATYVPRTIVVWEDNRSGNYDILGFDVPGLLGSTPGPKEALSRGIAAAARSSQGN